MSTWASIRHRLRALLQARTVRRELDEELRFHLAMEAVHREHAGATADDAKYAARRRLGNPTRIAEEVYLMSWRHSLEELAQDLRYGMRSPLRSRGVAFGALLTLSLGIGATAATFSVPDAVVLRPLPYAALQELLAVWTSAPQDPSEPFASSPPDFRELAAANISRRSRGRLVADRALRAERSGRIMTPQNRRADPATSAVRDSQMTECKSPGGTDAALSSTCCGRFASEQR